MHDDELDNGLTQRLRAYEARLPAPDAPEPAALQRRMGFGWPVLATAGASVVVAALLAVLVLSRPEAPVGDQSASLSPTAAATESVEATEAVSTPSVAPSATPAPTDAGQSSALAWRTIASFEGDGGPSMVNDVVAAGGGLVAVGVSYRAPLPNVGPTPVHRARVWTSSDGGAWNEVALGNEFENVTLEFVTVRADGSLLAVGTRGEAAGEVITETAPAAWLSADGRAWTESDSGLPAVALDLAEGPRGYLALIAPSGTQPQELWHSSDAVTWERVHELASGFFDIGAGEEGFVAAGGVQSPAGEATPYAAASADGRDWIVAPTPPPVAHDVAPLGTDWIAVTAFDEIVATGGVSFSANGLSWEDHGAIPLTQGDFSSAPGECGEYPLEISTAGGWLIAATVLTYPCSEGGFSVHARQWISSDGASWEVLPFETGTPGESRSGASVLGAIDAAGNLVLVGEKDGQATFWLGERD